MAVEDVKLEQDQNSCCNQLSAKYSKLEEEHLKLKEKSLVLKEKGKAFHEAVSITKLLTQQLDQAKADILILHKACAQERVRADAEKLGKDTEIAIRITLENQITNLNSQISLLKQKGESGAQVTALQNHISDVERETKRLKELLEKEKLKSGLEKKNADAEKRKAEIESKKAEEYRLQLEAEQKNRTREVQKHKMALEKKCADVEKSKTDALKKLLEENIKKNCEEKSYSNTLSRQLKESNKKIEELQNQVHELVSSKNALESGETKLASVKFDDATKRLEAEKRKASKEKKRADDLSRQLKEDKETIEELRKERNELVSSRNLLDPGKCQNDDFGIEKLKLMKKQLKLEKMRVKHALEMAELEKSRNDLLKQELGSLKQDFYHFSHRLNFLDNCLSCGVEDTGEPKKAGRLSKMHKSNSKREHCEKELLRPSGTLELSASPLLPRLNMTGFGSGTDCNLVSPIDKGSDRKKLQNSAISSSMASITNGLLIGSQEKGAFSVTTSADFPENSLKLQKSISRLSSKVTETRKNENVAVAVNSGRSPLKNDILDRNLASGRKRKSAPNSVESIDFLFSEGKKMQLQLNRSLEKARYSASNPLGDSHAYLSGVCKKRKVSKIQKPAIVKHSVDNHEREKIEKQNQTNILTGSTQVCMDGVIHSDTQDQETWISFHNKIADGDYMKLLDLENDVDEERYKKAMAEPLSPTLPIIDFECVLKVDKSKHSVEDILKETFSNEKGNMVISCNHDVNGPKINFNSLKKNGGHIDFDAFKGQTSKVNGFCSSSIDEGKSSHNNIQNYVILFSDIKSRDSISRIYNATRNCFARCCLVSQSGWAVQKILHAIGTEDVLPREKICVFFSLVLYHFSGFTFQNFGNFFTSGSKLCLDSFAGHVLSVVSGAETKELFSESLCIDELLVLIEDFLIDGKMLVCTDPSSNAPNDSMIRISLDSEDILLSYKTASHDQLVAGSIILASFCVAVDEVGFIYETSYNIFRTAGFGCQLMLTILHIFAYVCGETHFTLSTDNLIMVVIKSLVLYLETVDVSVDTDSLHFVSEDRSCSKCPFSQDAISVDELISVLLEKLHNNALPMNMHPDLKKSGNSIKSMEELDMKIHIIKSHGRTCCFCDTNFNEKSSSNKLGMLATQSESIISRFMCPCIDVISSLELVACKMSWAWSCKRVVPQLLTMLELHEGDYIFITIILLLGQLGRLGVEANGYEEIEVENIRNTITAFLVLDNYSVKLDLPSQLAIVNALLQLIPMKFNDVTESSTDVATIITSQSRTSDAIRKWFSLLDNEQKTVSFGFLQSVGVNDI